MSDTLKHYQEQWKIEHDKSSRLEQKNLDLLTQVQGLKRMLQQRSEEILQLEDKIHILNNKLEDFHLKLDSRENLEALQKQLLTPDDWTEEFIIPFVEELDAFPLLSELQYSRSARTPRDWCESLLETLDSLENIYSAKDIRQSKRTVIALWIYLQWLELIHEGKR